MHLSKIVSLCSDHIRTYGPMRATITLTHSGLPSDVVGGITKFTQCGPEGSILEVRPPAKGKRLTQVVALYSAKDMLETLMEHDLV